MFSSFASVSFFFFAFCEVKVTFEAIYFFLSFQFLLHSFHILCCFANKHLLFSTKHCVFFCLPQTQKSFHIELCFGLLVALTLKATKKKTLLHATKAKDRFFAPNLSRFLRFWNRMWSTDCEFRWIGRIFFVFPYFSNYTALTVENENFVLLRVNVHNDSHDWFEKVGKLFSWSV